MAREITQRELRNESGEIMRALDPGETFVVTRNGVPVGELDDSARTSTHCSISNPARVADARRRRGVIDTSVVIDLGRVDPGDLPEEIAISAVSLAELTAGPHATSDAEERARRQDRLQRVEATFEALPVDAAVARAYGRIHAAVAATALARELPLYTCNPADFVAVDRLVEVVAVDTA